MTSVPDATSALILADQRFAELRARYGEPRLTRDSTRGGESTEAKGSPFETLVRTVVSQQLSGTIADRLFERIDLLCGGELSPDAVVGVGREGLVSIGLSRAKAQSIYELAGKIVDGELALSIFEAMSDEEVTQLLLRLRGFGPWSAHMFLIFHLGRLDIWPSGDLGVRKGLSRLLEAPALLGPQETQLHGERWRPYRTIAAWYLWRLADGG
ncbi:MAG: DNA-3-methyladenine glycosylase family protein [Acidimicrobiales bacterium]